MVYLPIRRFINCRIGHALGCMMNRPRFAVLSVAWWVAWVAWGVGGCFAESANAAALGEAAGEGGREQVEFARPAACKPRLIARPAALNIADAAAAWPTIIEADSIEADDIDGAHGEGLSAASVVLRGAAQVVQGRRGLYADKIVYDRATGEARADGQVVFHSAAGDAITARALRLEVDTGRGEAQQIGIQIADRQGADRQGADRQGAAGQGAAGEPIHAQARARAHRIVFAGADKQRLEKVRMSTCAEGVLAVEDVAEDAAGGVRAAAPDVVLRADVIELDHAAGVGTARGMKVMFKETPIFYFPKVTFPLDERRKTGFLFPSAGYDDDSGARLEIPYYINLAPHYDALITPRLLSRRGAQIAAQFRYLSAHGRGALRGEFLGSDAQFDGRDRYAFGLDHAHRFGRRWSASVGLQSLSDAAYRRDFSSADEVTSSYAPQHAQLDYFGPQSRFEARATAYDSANPRLAESDRPYEFQPQLRWLRKPQKIGFFALGAEAEYSRFQRRDRRPGDDPLRTPGHGERLRLKPSISLPLRRSYGYFEAKTALQTIHYALARDEAPTRRSRSVSVPIFSLDSGLFFERAVGFESAADSDIDAGLDSAIETGRDSYHVHNAPPPRARYTQTLEPRLLYVNIAHKPEQRWFPNVDSSAGFEASFGALFRENRIDGGDRVGDAEQLTVGLSSRLIDRRDGQQRLKLSLGRVFYFADRRITLADDPRLAEPPPRTEHASGVIAEASASLAAGWQANGFARWGSRDTPDAFRLAARFAQKRRGRRYSGEFAYVYRGAWAGAAAQNLPYNDRVARQLNAAFDMPLSARWQLHGDVAYSLAEKSTQSAAAGLRFDGCCWAARLGFQRYLDGGGEHKNRFIFTFELDDLGKLKRW